jgi:hypothetical protein
MGIIMTFLCCGFLQFFPQGFRGFCTSIYYIFKFYPLGFSKIIFILCNIQVLKGECYNTNICDHLTQDPGTTVVAVGAPKVEPSHPPLEPSHPRMYKRKEGMRN